MHSFKYWLVTTSEYRDEKKIEVLYSGYTETLFMLHTKTNGYYDMRTSYGSPFEYQYTVHKFDGSKYNASECYFVRSDDNKKYRMSCK